MDKPVQSYAVDHMQLDPELARLKAQATLTWEEELDELLRLGVCDGASMLDAGSGAGFVTQLLLESFPSSNVTAVDKNEAMIAHTRQLLSGYDRWSAVLAPISNLPLQSCSFDVVYARYLVQHLPQPLVEFRELVRVLQPGGKLLVVDVDDGAGVLTIPEMPELDEIQRRIGERQAARGGNRHIGRRLPVLLMNAGLVDVRMRMIVVHSSLKGLDPFMRVFHPDPSRLAPLIKAGHVSAEEVQREHELLETLATTPGAALCYPLFVASGCKASA